MTIQLSDINWPVFSLVLAFLLIFGSLYAWLTNFLAHRGISDHTVWMVIFGSLVTIIGAGFLIGLLNTLLVFACFSASGLPMVIEFVARTENKKRADRQAAIDATKGML